MNKSKGFRNTFFGDRMKNQSYWQASVKPLILETLQDSRKDEVSIIGGGLTGILCAYYLKESGLNISVYEANTFGSGSSGHTTAKITTQHGFVYSTIESMYSLDDALAFYTVNKDAIDEIERIIQKENIDCDFERKDFILTSKDSATFNKEKETLLKMDIPFETKENQLIFKNQAQFHPLKFLNALIEICKEKGIHFYPHTRIEKISKEDFCYYLKTHKENTIETSHLVLATRFPIREFPSFYSIKLHQNKDYVFMGKEEHLKDDMIFCDNPVKSYRNYKDYGIYVEDETRVGIEVQHLEEVKKDLEEKHQFCLHMTWTNQDVYSGDPIPYIGRFSSKDEYCYMATGYNGWGMTTSVIAGKLISDLIQHRHNDYQELFEPGRHYFKGDMKTLLLHQGHVLHSEIKERLNFNSNIQMLMKGEGKVFRIHGKLKGVYLDESGNYHIIDPVCPHLKGILSFNANEKTWECPCHGSRFDIHGQLIDGPSCYGLKKGND